VFFNDTKVPIENMLGERGAGFKIALNSLNVGRIKLAAGCMDAQRRIINLATNYANERVQFKTPIAQFGAIKKKLADMATSAFVSDAGIYRGAYDIEKKIKELEEGGMGREEAELKAFEEFAIEAAILKVYVSEQIQMVSDEGLQIYGGMGFSEETPMEAAWRDARITRIYEGTNEINRLLTIDMLLKKALKGKLDLLGPATEVGKSLMGIPSFDMPDFSAPLAEEKDMIARLKKAFLMVSGKAVQTYGMELEKHQQLILAAAEVLIEIYMAESAVLKAEKLVEMNGVEKANLQIAMAQLNLFKAVEKINMHAKEAIYYFSDGDEQRMMLMGLKRFTKYQNAPNTLKLRQLVANEIIKENKYPF
jgi:alkylation response protein AidB-like acyl-CoA dehydrogenase